MRKIILASSSPRRRRLLELIGLNFEVIPPDIKEKQVFGDVSDLEEACKKVALLKARNVTEKVKSGIIISADTIGLINNRILTKPKNKEDAKKILKMLSGKEHTVITALVILDLDNKKEIVDVVKTRVKFRKLSNEEINNYVESGEPLDKAAAYAIQGRAAS
ncbi:MAG TPA: septum formation protein Maf, partial [Candidatus Aenigmarchaeota archaeon]|nr:septum formation protein Maf [Candidatus Aenigmarchaeota archaeon]